MWGHIHEMEGNFEHLAHEHWTRTSGRIILKFRKNQTESENHKICRGIMISYAEAKKKIEKVSDKLSRTLLRNQRISVEDPKSWKVVV